MIAGARDANGQGLETQKEPHASSRVVDSRAEKNPFSGKRSFATYLEGPGIALGHVPAAAVRGAVSVQECRRHSAPHGRAALPSRRILRL